MTLTYDLPKGKSAMRFSSKQLIIHNIQIHGMKACLYCFGLSASRYIEYLTALQFLSEQVHQGSTVVEIGCGHSMLPTFWQRMGLDVIMVDTNRGALCWQLRKAKAFGKNPDLVLADLRYLPLADESVTQASCISALEHVAADGDIKGASEIGRILRPKGTWVVSVPLSATSPRPCENECVAEIPKLMHRLLGKVLPTIMRVFNVDRTSSYFERFFSRTDLVRRIIKPSHCYGEQFATLRSGHFVTFLYHKVIPTGVLTILEYSMARALIMNDRIEDAHAIILKLRKDKDQNSALKTSSEFFPFRL